MYQYVDLQTVFDSIHTRAARHEQSVRKYVQTVHTIQHLILPRRKDLVNPVLREELIQQFWAGIPKLSPTQIDRLPYEMQTRWTGDLPYGWALALAALPQGDLLRGLSTYWFHGEGTSGYTLYGNPLYYLKEDFELPNDVTTRRAKDALHDEWSSRFPNFPSLELTF